MAAKTKKRHYRVAQKEVSSPNKGIWIENDKKNQYILLAIGLFIFTFIKGFIIGYFVSRD
ncbi:hypothetical protein [Defluviitalea phaphyphila]|uniref:hypothetical protein n=1 Tax=Defluviitalea phaphyphila TaxID=1473580 RepID=UPI00072FBF1F|nr:hypothetical protein [Defluviitalea phaphyphila]